MRITDELRAFARKWGGILGPDDGKKELLSIADRIDAEHMDELKQCSGYWAVLLDEARTEGIQQGIQQGIEVDLEAREQYGWVELPKDADGEYIHIGDVMERGEARGCVIALMLSNYPKKWGGALHWAIQLEGERAPTALDNFFHHYHKPTVEDMLWELLGDIRPDMEDKEAVPIVKAYAEKLRLADDGEEQ